MKRYIFLIFVITALLAIPLGTATPSEQSVCSQATAAPVSQSQAAELAHQYAPTLHFHKDEQYRPTSFARYVALAEETDGFNTNISLEDLQELDSENTLTVEDSHRYTTDYDLPNYVYASVHRNVSYQDDTYTAITYWMFYIHDGKVITGTLKGWWMNKHFDTVQHTGDLETLTILLQDGDPQWVGASQHYGGEIRKWEHVPTNGTHPKLYPALGAHSVYFVDTSQPAYDGGNIVGQGHHLPDQLTQYAVTGVPSNLGAGAFYDDETGNTTVWTPADYTLSVLDGSEPWQRFAGPISSDNDPRLPKHRQRWRCPGAWMDAELVEDINIHAFDLSWPLLSLNDVGLDGNSAWVKPQLENTGSQPHEYHVQVRVYTVTDEGENGQLIGIRNTTMLRETDAVDFLPDLGKYTEKITVDVDRSTDCVNIEVTAAPYEISTTNQTDTISKETGQHVYSCHI